MRHSRSRSNPTVPVSPAEFHILMTLADGDRHGYGIMQQVAADSAGAITLGPGTLYGAIRRLLEYRYIREVESRIDPALDDARRRYYRLTPAGRSAATVEARRLADLVGLARAKRLIDAAAPAGGSRS